LEKGKLLVHKLTKIIYYSKFEIHPNMRNMNFRNIILFICFIALNKISLAQSGERNQELRSGYIITKNNEFWPCYFIKGNKDSISDFVIYLKDKNSSPVKLSHKDINGYTYEGARYDVVPYGSDSIFMERMNKYEPILYYHKNRTKKEFYIKKNNELILLPSKKNELIAFLKEEMKDCESSIENIKFASYNKERLSKIFEKHSSCDSTRITQIKSGFLGGLKLSKLKLDENLLLKYNGKILDLSNVEYPFNSGFLFGVFIDVPFNGNSNERMWSFHPELVLENVNYKIEKYKLYYEVGGKALFGFNINYYTLNLFIRHKGLEKENPIFWDMGFVYSKIHVLKSYVNEGGSTYELEDKLAKSFIGLGCRAGISINNFINCGIQTNYMIATTSPKVWNVDFVIGIEL